MKNEDKISAHQQEIRDQANVTILLARIISAHKKKMQAEQAKSLENNITALPMPIKRKEEVRTISSEESAYPVALLVNTLNEGENPSRIRDQELQKKIQPSLSKPKLFGLLNMNPGSQAKKKLKKNTSSLAYLPGLGQLNV